MQPVDGDFRPVTKNCVMEYQRGKNITVDGVVGRETWGVIVTT
jgi:peptidoglycan hydrolase-like protein with peptidoglycan-binding domain